MPITNFDTILDFVFTLYDLITTSSFLVWEWFSDTIDSSIAEFLSLPLDTTNLELMLGTFVPAMLALTLVGFVTKALFP